MKISKVGRERAQRTVPIKSVPFRDGLPSFLSLSLSLTPYEASQHFCQPLAIFTPIPLCLYLCFLPLPLPLAWLLFRSAHAHNSNKPPLFRLLCLTKKCNIVAAFVLVLANIIMNRQTASQPASTQSGQELFPFIFYFLIWPAEGYL